MSQGIFMARSERAVLKTFVSSARVNVRNFKPKPHKGGTAPPPEKRLYRCTDSRMVGPPKTYTSTPEGSPGRSKITSAFPRAGLDAYNSASELLGWPDVSSH